MDEAAFDQTLAASVFGRSHFSGDLRLLRGLSASLIHGSTIVYAQLSTSYQQGNINATVVGGSTVTAALHSSGATGVGLFRAPGLYWAFGSVADNWYGVPVRAPVGLVVAVGLARGGTLFLSDPYGSVETVDLPGVSAHARAHYLCCMVRDHGGVRCGINIHLDSIGSRARWIALRLRLILHAYLSSLLGSGANQVEQMADQILRECVVLASSMQQAEPLYANLSTRNGSIVLSMTVRIHGVLERIEVSMSL